MSPGSWPLASTAGPRSVVARLAPPGPHCYDVGTKAPCQVWIGETVVERLDPGAVRISSQTAGYAGLYHHLLGGVTCRALQCHKPV